jgi:hypothetical protein
MRLPFCPPSCLASAALLAAVLVAPPALGRPLHLVQEGALAARTRGLPAALHLLPAEAGVESPSLPVVDTGVRQEPPKVEPHVPTPQNLKADAPVTPGAWVMYGTSALVPLGGIYGASRMGGERLWVTGLETVAGSVVGGLPGTLLFLQPAHAGGRWTELDVAAFTTGLVLTPPLAALGTWGLGELAFDGSRERGRAFLGALGGAAVGTLLGVVMHGALEEIVGNTDSLKALRKYIAIGFIGSGATLGYQWAGGGPRPRSR